MDKVLANRKKKLVTDNTAADTWYSVFSLLHCIIFCSKSIFSLEKGVGVGRSKVDNTLDKGPEIFYICT